MAKGRLLGVCVVAALAGAGCGSSSSGSSSAKGIPETPGGLVHTWSDYTTAGGAPGAQIPAFKTIDVACRIQGFKVQDGNVWWYKLASAPWDSHYYGSADAFYNNGETSGSLHGTPDFDPKVPVCS